MPQRVDLLIVAIHQPNYLPWLGYFAKIAQADEFVFLDDAQYSKNSYINRVQIAGDRGPRWLTIPVTYTFSDPINRVAFARPDWRKSHLDKLFVAYRNAAAFRATWPWLEELYASMPSDNLASTNAAAIVRIATRLGLEPVFHFSSALGIQGRADQRLAAIVNAIAPGGTYLSGNGGATYQAEDTFSRAGLTLRYSKFVHPRYPQGEGEFMPGLSVLDAIFHLGWRGTGNLVTGAIQ